MLPVSPVMGNSSTTVFFDQQKRGIWRVPVSGGPETLVLDKEISPILWDLTDGGIYFIDSNAKPMATICVYDFASRHIRTLAPVHSDLGFVITDGFSVAPDRKWLLYSGGIWNSEMGVLLHSSDRYGLWPQLLLPVEGGISGERPGQPDMGRCRWISKRRDFGRCQLSPTPTEQIGSSWAVANPDPPATNDYKMSGLLESRRYPQFGNYDDR